MDIQEFQNFFLKQIKLKINELKEERYNKPNKLKLNKTFEEVYLSIYDESKKYLNRCGLESYFSDNYFVLVPYLFESINEIYTFNNIQENCVTNVIGKGYERFEYEESRIEINFRNTFYSFFKKAAIEAYNHYQLLLPKEIYNVLMSRF